MRLSCRGVVILEPQRLFGAICSVHRALVRQNDVNLAEHGISAVQLHTLVFIHIMGMKGKKVCQRDVERETGLRPSSVSSMLANLERADFITRTPADSDARTKYITLNPLGLEICESNKELMDKCDEQVCAALTPEEQLTLKNLLMKVQNSLEK